MGDAKHGQDEIDRRVQGLDLGLRLHCDGVLRVVGGFARRGLGGDGRSQNGVRLTPLGRLGLQAGVQNGIGLAPLGRLSL